MKKILILINTGFYSYGGLATVMMNYYSKLDLKKYQVDFASTNPPETNDSYYLKLKENNSNYYSLGNRKKNLLKYLKNLKKILLENKYDVIHVNGNSATLILELIVAKKCNIPVRIAHGHTTSSNYPIIHKILKNQLKKYYTTAIAVSDKTGQWLYDENYTVLNNAIDVEKYLFNEKVRLKLRKMFNCENKFIIGHVGKLYAPKNHKFLIDVFFEYQKNNSDAMLIIVGGGELEETLKKQVKDLKIEHKVLFLGMRNDIPDLLQIFDVFVFPSIYEGLGLALIEAQASGLKCIASSNVPIETKVTNNVEYLGLDEDIKKWVDSINKTKISNRKNEIQQVLNQITKNNYNMSNEVKKLEEIYNGNN